jgi:hypothetical protein
MFIQTESTPNPATLKFLPGKVVMQSGTADFRDADEAGATSQLAAKLFGIPGVIGVFYGYDFITITKDDADWQHLKPAILGTIMEHFMSGAPVMSGAAAETPQAKRSSSRPATRPLSPPSRNCLKAACAPPSLRMAATSPSADSAMARCSCT